MVLASSIERAVHIVVRSGPWFEVSVDGGPRRLQSGSADCAHSLSNEPKDMMLFVGLKVQLCVLVVLLSVLVSIARYGYLPFRNHNHLNESRT